MKSKTVGIIVFALCIILAIVILTLSRSKGNNAQQSSQQVPVQTQQAQQVPEQPVQQPVPEQAQQVQEQTQPAQVQQPVSEQTQPVQEQPAPEQTQPVQEQPAPEQTQPAQVQQPVPEQTQQVQEQTPQAPSSGVLGNQVVMQKVVNESKLSYSGADQTTMGIVKSKSCYLSGTQIIYAVEIEVTMGTNTIELQYFCNYNTYDTVFVGDLLNVVYKQTSTNTFAVMTISRA